LAAGFAFAHETYRLSNGALLRQANGAAVALPAMTFQEPDNVYAGPINLIQGGGNAPSGTPLQFPAGSQRGKRDNQAVWLFDTIEIGPRWRLDGGLRFEHNEGENQSGHYTSFGFLPSGSQVPGAAQAGAPGGVFSGPGPVFRSKDDLLSWRVGAVFKPVDTASVYLAYGNSKTPAQTAVNGACNANSCEVDPEEAFNLELGGKWELHGGKLLLTAAVFRNERSAFRVDSGIPGVPQRLDGRSRVDGVSLGASGVIRKGWAVFANYTFLDSELLQSVSDGMTDFRAGDPLPNTPRHAFNLWTTYDLTSRVQVGYGATYSGEYAFNRSSSATPLFHAPAYWLHNAAVTVKLTDAADLRLNIRNLTDEVYYTRIRSAGSLAVGGFGWATPGEARSVVATLNCRF
jgi:catecholate siderophore receptor